MEIAVSGERATVLLGPVIIAQGHEPYSVSAAASNFLCHTVVVQLGVISRIRLIEWFEPRTRVMRTGDRMVGLGQQTFTASIAGDAVLYLTAS